MCKSGYCSGGNQLDWIVEKGVCAAPLIGRGLPNLLNCDWLATLPINKKVNIKLRQLRWCVTAMTWLERRFGKGVQSY